MFFLPIILVSLFVAPGLFGAQVVRERSFEFACEKKILNGHVQSLAWGQEGSGNAAMTLLRIGGEQESCVFVEVPSLERKEHLQANFSPNKVDSSNHQLVFDADPNSLNGLRDTRGESAVAGIMNLEVKKRIHCSMLSENGYYFAVGLDDGTVQLYHKAFTESWSHRLLTTLCKPKIYVPLFFFCLACVGVVGGYRGWKYWNTSMKHA